MYVNNLVLQNSLAHVAMLQNCVRGAWFESWQDPYFALLAAVTLSQANARFFMEVILVCVYHFFMNELHIIV